VFVLCFNEALDSETDLTTKKQGVQKKIRSRQCRDSKSNIMLLGPLFFFKVIDKICMSDS